MSDILVYFSEGSHIVVPLYQRNYDWKKQNCKQLIDDIVRLTQDETGEKKHFTGAVIYTNEGMNRVIIDGQQRVTTAHLILLAIRDAINAKEISSTTEKTLVKIDERLGEESSILIPCGKDNDAYQALYQGKYNDEWSLKEYGHTNIWKNYKYLKDEILQKDTGDNFAEVFFKAVMRLWVVPIELKENDDPQAVFESINTTGLKLSDADRIRNFIMMNHPTKVQQKIYNDYWVKIEEYVGDEIENFFIDFLKAETFNKVLQSNNGVYITFKNVFGILKDSGDEKWNVLGRIRDLAKIYHGMLTNNIFEYVSSEANRALKYISYLKQRVTYSFILNLLAAELKGDLTKEEVSKSILYTEIYIERRQAVKEPTNILNGFFPSLYKVVRSLPGTAPFSDKLAYLLTSKEGSLWVPTDEYIKENLAHRKIYKTSDTCDMILAVANYVNNESSDPLDKMNVEGGYTLDHIMPQNPDAEWREQIPDIEELLNTHLDTIGNLTLTAYNSNFGNRSFSYRLNVPGIGYMNSPLHVNDYLKKQTTWGKEQIEERANEIIDWFLNNRKIPSSNGYAPGKDDVFEGNLSEDADVFTNKTILGYIYENDEFVPVKTAKECYLGLMKKLYGEFPDKFTEWAEAFDTHGMPAILFTEPDEENHHVKLTEGIYIQSHIDNYQKFKYLYMTIKELDFDGNKITIQYKMKVKN